MIYLFIDLFIDFFYLIYGTFYTVFLTAYLFLISTTHDPQPTTHHHLNGGIVVKEGS